MLEDRSYPTIRLDPYTVCWSFELEEHMVRIMGTWLGFTLLTEVKVQTMAKIEEKQSIISNSYLEDKH